MANKNSRIQRIIVNAKVHRNKNKKRLGFELPHQAIDALGIEPSGWITVLIRATDGRPLYLGKKKMTSNCEVYGTDMNIKRGNPIFVEISDPTQ
jgi:hypothetical protein